MRGLDVARVQLFFSFSHDGIEYPCALVHWFSREGDLPSVNTGMWVVSLFRYLAPNVSQGLFLSQIHLIILLVSMSTNTWITMHLRSPSNYLFFFLPLFV